MPAFKPTLAAAGAAALLAGCAADFTAPGVVAEAENTMPSADPFAQALYEGYLDNARYELERMEDTPDAQFFAERAIAAAQGRNVEPQQVAERDIPEQNVAELTEARSRLMSVMAEGREVAPDATGRAIAKYDCWLEQQEENFQPGDIAACKADFYAALADIDAAILAAVPPPPPPPPPAPELPEVITMSSQELFDFDSATVKDSYREELDRIAEAIRSNEVQDVTILGHTDSVGSAEYNQRLSERRAQAVADYLVQQGVASDLLVVEGLGERQPIASNETEEGRAQNRRVELQTTLIEG